VYVCVRILTWNLKHGRSVPSSGRDLFAEFAAMLAGWDWEVALIQEVPPWWPAPLAQRTGAEERHALTSRNSLLPVRRAIAVRWPDAIKSNGGGCNAILVRGSAIAEHRTRRLALVPERRWVHGVRLGRLWVSNLHTGASIEQARLAAETVSRWAGRWEAETASPRAAPGHRGWPPNVRGGGLPAVLGGDFNLRSFSLEGFTRAGGHGVDQVLLGGWGQVRGETTVLERGRLSDHAPVLVTVPGLGD
jgi:endonuclease/exonuclease/phosphatase family metal-dependent hydrolase